MEKKNNANIKLNKIVIIKSVVNLKLFNKTSNVKNKILIKFKNKILIKQLLKKILFLISKIKILKENKVQFQN